MPFLRNTDHSPLITGVLLAMLATLPARVASADGVDYEVILDRPQTQTVRVRVSLDDVGDGPVELKLPAWRPGKYAILDNAGTVRWYRASDATGRELEVAKADKATWVVDPDGADAVTLEYEIYANRLADRTMHVDDTHAFLDASATMMYAPARRAEPARVRIDAPEGWSIATGLDPSPDDPALFVAPDYDVLVDSPFEIGLHDTLEFEVDGVPHEIVIWGTDEYDAERMIEDFSSIVRVQAAMFGGLPYERYVFMLHATDEASGATEHLNSTIIQGSARSFPAEGAYGRLGMVSHELFHTWNVKHARPAGLSPYDYERENYTTLLWVAEGTTSYYEDLFLVRAGINDPDDYIRDRARAFERFARRPGARVQSLEDSSFDAWIKDNRSTPDSVNTTVSFYTKGALVSMLLDLTIRQASGGEASLDDVMRDLFEATGWGGPGFTTEQLQAAAEARAGRDLNDFFDRYVRGTDELDHASVLDGVGLRVVRDGDDEESDEDRSEAYVGLNLRGAGGFAEVREVLEDGPAFDAGVQVGDTIVAINGDRLTGSNLDDLLEDVEPGEPVELSIVRKGRLRTIAFAAGGRETRDVRFERVDEPTEAQRASYESWLGQPWPEEPDDVAAIEGVLDGWHAAAAEADLDRYFGHMADDSVFMGTDATERWDREAFLAFATPYFERGRAWTFRPRERVVTVGPRGRTAWFDELLDSEAYGEMRGSGVLVKEGDDWKIAQYNLSIPLPNDLAKGVVEQIDAWRDGGGGVAGEGPR